MRQEITIIVTIDIEAALNENTLDGNIYLTDNLRTEGSMGESTGNLVSILNGSHWADGSQADEQVLNWLASGIGMLPPTLPNAYYAPQTATSAAKDLDDASQKLKGTAPTAAAVADAQLKIAKAAQNVGITGKVRTPEGVVQDTGMKVVDLFGQSFSAAPNRAKTTSVSMLNYLTPQISDISGEAVEKGILYPAQYGTPIAIKNGWYWSAAASTYTPGTYAYTMHITLYKPTIEKGTIIWEPVFMTYDSHVKVTSVAKNNAFTGAGMAVLPII